MTWSADASAATQRAGVRLAVDVGEARVGLAATDPDALVATPVMTLRRDRTKGSDIRMVTKIAADRSAVAIYVGLPLSLSGVETQSTEKARHYAQQLADSLDSANVLTEVRLVDERLSTVSAAGKMLDSGVRSADQRAHIDQAAAVEILTHALNVRAAQMTEPGVAVKAHGT